MEIYVCPSINDSGRNRCLYLLCFHALLGVLATSLHTRKIGDLYLVEIDWLQHNTSLVSPGPA